MRNLRSSTFLYLPHAFCPTAIDEDGDTASMEEAGDNSKVFEVESEAAEGAGGESAGEEEPPEGEVEADQPFNPVPLKELVQAPNKEDLFGTNWPVGTIISIQQSIIIVLR